MSRTHPSDLTVSVDLNGEVVDAGRIGFRFRGSAMTTSFAYSSEYLAERHAYSFDPQWALDTAPHNSVGLPPAFADTAPDWWGRHLIGRRIRAEAAISGLPASPVTDLDVLLGVSDISRQGALRFREPRGSVYLAADANVPRLMDLETLLVAADTIAEDPEDDPTTRAALTTLLAAGSGTLGGARPKASVLDGERLLVAKFPSAEDAWDVIAWEKTALDLASAAGLRVPHRELVSLGDRHVLLLERFDRVHTRRVGYVSAGTFIGGGRTASRDYLDLVAAIEDHSGDVEADLVDLLRRIVFSLAINNTDDHTRNIAFLRTSTGWRLSPVYDVNPDPEIGKPRATSVFGHLTRSQGLDALREGSAYFGVSAAGVNHIIDATVSAISDWRRVAESNDVNRASLERFAPVFDWLGQ